MGTERAPDPTYTVREASEVAGLTQRQVRSLITEDILHPQRTASGRYLLAFTDIVLLRAIAQLTHDGVPMARVRTAVRRLREQLADESDLTAASLDAAGHAVVVTVGDDSWEPESGQVVLDLESHAERAAVVTAPRRRAPSRDDASASEWYAHADQLEATEPATAEAAYRRAIELDDEFAEAHVDLGRLLHAAGAVHDALDHYRRAHEIDAEDATTLFNLGVAYDDLRMDDEAIEAYRTAIELAPRFADARFNLASVHERRGEVGLALQELRAYKELIDGR